MKKWLIGAVVVGVIIAVASFGSFPGGSFNVTDEFQL